ncbi:protein of unknown function [Petrocella atlantisensis]|uniref:Uncharacterized protein n=1 Tax=Petrocella atlantisensis TaxID=2173034 RepID=A0A3P7NYI0_9FIRM|nr:protein of unknown function [Petrocella atlantisensis]
MITSLCYTDFGAFASYRGVAQLGRALGSGLRGRRFKSSHSDFLMPFIIV